MRALRRAFLSTTMIAASLTGHAAYAQQAGAEAPVQSQNDEDSQTAETVIIVTGSNIQGSRATETLPITIINQNDIDAIGAIDGDDLIRSLPTQGAVDFRNDLTGTVNNARGDVSSINLRSIGPGNTLVLLNGRRMVLHPGTQSDNLVPAVTVNANAMPVAGIKRIEVLNDGASAIYGSDAVAGVFNTILKSDFEGLAISGRYGLAENTNHFEQQVTLEAGKTFNNGRTNISFVGEYSRRNGAFARELPFAASDDARPQVAGTTFDGNTAFDNTSTRTPWGQFTLRTTSATRVRQNGVALTTTSGVFHIQPIALGGCLGSTATTLSTPGLCIDDGTLDRELRFDTGTVNHLLSDRDRFNGFLFLNHDLGGGTKLYGEFGYYYAKTRSLLEQNTSIASGEIAVPANNYWNPFGPITFADGRVNPNRLPGLTNVPAAGRPVFVDGARFRLVDVGPREVNVKNTSWRALLGARGELGDSKWHWDTAVLYSKAETRDLTNNRVSSTLFQRALNNDTPSAYNVFNGADPNRPSFDSTLNPQSVIDPFLISVERRSSTELGVADFKATNAQLFELPGGPLGFAFGIEGRYEAYVEDRDPRLDGTIVYTDIVTGAVSDSDVLGTSATFDSNGSREVYSAFGELSVPVIGEDMNVPLVRHLDLQLAGRYEQYSDIGGSGFKPRIAASWEPFDFLKFRGSWAKGFRAPNLLTINEVSVARTNTRTDSIACEAGVRNGTFATFNACTGFTEAIEEQRAGNPDLNPEDNRSFTYGVAFAPRGLSGIGSVLNGLTVTVDFWDIKQENVVGIFGGGNHLDLDYALRVNGGSNPNVVRAAPTIDQIAFYSGTGLAPAGSILFITDTYLNLLPRRIRGVDVAVYYELDDTPLGDFSFKFNAAKLREFSIEPSANDQIILDAITNGDIDSSVTIAGSGNIIRQNGQPKWQASGAMTWRHDSGFGAGLFGDYTGSYIDTGVGLDINGDPFTVDDWLIFNGYVQYEFPETAGFLKDSRIRFGVNNIADKDPPLVDSSFNFDGAYHNARGRYYYFDFRFRL